MEDAYNRAGESIKATLIWKALKLMLKAETQVNSVPAFFCFNYV